MRKRIASVATLLLLFMATVAAAENRAQTFSLTPFAGGYVFDGKQHLNIGPAFGLRAGYNFTDQFGVEGLFDYIMPEGTLDDQTPDVYNYSLNLLYHFFPKNRLVPFVTAGYGGITTDPEGRSATTKGAFNYGAGVKYALSESMELRGEVRHLLFKSNTETLSNVEFGIGLGFLFGGAAPPPPPVVAAPPPPEPAPAPAPVVVPPPPAPTSSLSVTPGSITKGESATLNWSSQNATNCDIQPGIGPVNTQGSMTMKPAADTAYTLTCSGPGGKTSSAANITVAAPPPEMLCYKIDIEFDTAKWNIKPQYHDELAKLAKFLKDYPALTGVIEGYTDNVGGEKSNQKLSEKRAKSVRDYLVTKLGIDGSRLTSKGFGESKPVADNSTAAGRQKNRRVVANFECVEKKQ